MDKSKDPSFGRDTIQETLKSMAQGIMYIGKNHTSFFNLLIFKPAVSDTNKKGLEQDYENLNLSIFFSIFM